MKKLDSIIKKLNLLIMGVSMCCVFTIGLTLGLETRASANQNYTTEEVLLQKDSIIKELVKYEDGLNPFFATSKATQLSNLSIEKLNKLVDRGYVVLVVDDNTNKNLPEPVKVNGNQVVVSIHSNDGALVDVLNNLLVEN